ncbi:MAG: hypothetical protein ACOX22_08090 [Caldicoprobacterales bacterium]|jgi:hypothetical protein
MLQAGFCRLDVTPPLGIDMPGYYTRRLSTGILDPLTVTAVALSDSSTQAVLITAGLYWHSHSRAGSIEAGSI